MSPDFCPALDCRHPGRYTRGEAQSSVANTTKTPTDPLPDVQGFFVKGGVNVDRFGGAKIDQLAGIQRFAWDGWNGA